MIKPVTIKLTVHDHSLNKDLLSTIPANLWFEGEYLVLSQIKLQNHDFFLLNPKKRVKDVTGSYCEFKMSFTLFL